MQVGHHHYMLFGASTGDTIEHPQLRAVQCFELMLRVAQENPDAHHVIFAGQYDAIMWTHLLPTSICQRMLDGKWTRYDRYRFRYYAGKMFTLSDGTRSLTVYDVFSFFGTKFVTACREYLGNDETLDHIESMKDRRSTFERDAMPEVKHYMSLELEYLVKLMNELRDRLTNVGIDLTRWHGPGAVASRVLAMHKIGDHMKRDERVTPTARYAYYGGRFEQFRAGFYQGKVYEYDIRSAYPSAIVRLPSLHDVRCRHTTGDRARFTSDHALYKVSWDGPYGTPGPLPWRHPSGAIFYPSKGIGWYWGIEVRNLVDYWPSEWYTIHESFTPTRTDDRPFAWVEAMYDHRALLKAQGDPSQLALKLALNSLYGKMAQSKGAYTNREGEWVQPRWHQIEWAGWTTAYCRHLLYDGIMQAGEDLIAVETDALFTTKPLALDIGPGLGQWEESVFDGILYLQSGVYFVNESGTWKCKTRGFEPKGHTFERWYEYSKQCPDDEPGLAMRSHRFGTLPGTDTFAKWFDQPRELRLDNLFTKRAHYGALCRECMTSAGPYSDCMHHLVVPEPLIGKGDSRAHSLPWAPHRESLEWGDDDLVLADTIDW